MPEHAVTRKFVKPAHPGARIPDPAHAGLDLPADGAEVTWDHYWITRERRGEIVATDVVTPPADVASPPDTGSEAEAPRTSRPPRGN